jgi:pyruvate ferredoxin oxidoreductase alpha subunit
MGYYPITPSTQIAEELDQMKADGEHDIVMIAGDGEHGAAGICFGAACGGGRVANATSAQGLLYSLEQLPAQSGTRLPMLLNVVNRAINSPLDILCDHSDIMFTLNAGWIIFMARNPQMVYDLDIIGLKVGEHKEVRLPVIVSSDGFFTSHQKRRINIFKDPKLVQRFIGSPSMENHALDPRSPVTIGPYMNDPDYINTAFQHHQAMEKSREIIPLIFKEYGELTGRYYSPLESYYLEDAEVAIFLLNSAYDTATIAVDRMRAQGKKVGALTLNVIRPFPSDELCRALKNIKVLIVGDRQESFGAKGGNMTIEIKAALKDDPQNTTTVLSRIYGLGGKHFYETDAEEMINQALDLLNSSKRVPYFAYHGANPGDPSYTMPKTKGIPKERLSPGIIKVTQNPKTKRLEVKGVVLNKLTCMPKRIAPGHGACRGCGIFSSLDTFLKGIEGDVVFLFHTGCAMVVTTGYPYSSHRVTYIHNLFQNGAATMAGLVEVFYEKKRRGELPEDEDITFIMITGDGGFDIGMGPAIGAALRNHRMIILEYDNEGYMNTGAQLSYTTPMGHITSTSNVGPFQCGKTTHHKDTAQIMAACHIPYVFTGIECEWRDLISKAAKAQWYAKNKGLVFGKILSVCPLSWRTDPKLGQEIIKAAVNSNFFPLYEIEQGITTINYDPEQKGKKIPLKEWFKMMGKTKHLTQPENEQVLKEIENEVERRWRRLKAMHENPLL